MPKNPEFKKPEGVHFKQPEAEASSLFGEEPERNAAGIPNIEWLDMPSEPVGYPYNGEPVWLTPDAMTEYLATWRVTREFRNGRFTPTAFWVYRNSGGQRIHFEPLGYRRYEEPIYLPKKKA